MKKFFLCICFPFVLGAWSLSPSSHTMIENNYYYVNVDGRKATKPVPIEVYAAKRIVDEQGQDTWERVLDEFTVYPNVFVLQPGAYQKVRVIWKGDLKRLQKEKAYRIVLEQMPVKVKNKTKDPKQKDISVVVSVLKKYVTSLYICPKNSSFSLEMEDHRFYTENGERFLELSLVNSGNRHATIRKYGLLLSNETSEFLIDDKYTNALNQHLLILPDHKRVWTVPLPKDLPEDFSLENCIPELQILKHG